MIVFFGRQVGRAMYSNNRIIAKMINASDKRLYIAIIILLLLVNF